MGQCEMISIESWARANLKTSFRGFSVQGKKVNSTEGYVSVSRELRSAYLAKPGTILSYQTITAASGGPYSLNFKLGSFP